MQSKEITIGRNFSLILEHGEEFFSSLEKFCENNSIKQAYIPGFIAGFKTVKIVGTLEEKEDKSAPVWDHVYLENVEVLGSGTIAFDDDGKFSPHIHVSLGEKFSGAKGYSGHLLEAEVLFLSEMLVVEVTIPRLIRIKNKDLYDIPLLTIMDA